MSIHLFPRRPAAPMAAPLPGPLPVEPYYQLDQIAAPVIRLRPLTSLEQMYAYWGSDRV